MKHPECTNEPRDCRVVAGAQTGTLMAWERVFDGEGRPVTSDPNIYTTRYRCQTCDREWTVKQRGDKEWIS